MTANPVRLGGGTLDVAEGGGEQSGKTGTGARVVRVALIGQGIAASRTPRMHMDEGKAQGLDYDYRMIDTAGTPPDVAALLDDLEASGLDGLNVTYPHKQAIIPHLDVLSEAAASVGAVNTVVFRDGRRFGHNTDYWGFGESFRRDLPDAAREAVLLLGAGGAGGAVANALLDQGAGRLLVHDVSADAARSLVARLGSRAAAAGDLAQAAAIADGIVNATPMGMEKLPGMAIPADLVEPRHWVADIVYFPLETELLGVARARGCAVLPGSGMAVFQAVRAFELFTGLKADPDRMWRTFASFDAEAPA